MQFNSMGGYIPLQRWGITYPETKFVPSKSGRVHGVAMLLNS